MFTPRELEGEVDHSFFDSDSECAAVSQDGRKKGEEMSTSGKNGSHLSQSNNAAQREPSECGRPVGTGQNDPSRSSVGHTSGNAIGNGGNINKSSGVDATSHALSSDEEGIDDEDGYQQSQDESEEEEGPPPARKASGPKSGNTCTPKKLVRKRPPRSASPPSSSDTETDSGSSSCCSDTSSSTEPNAPASRSKASPPSSSSSLGRGRSGSHSGRGHARPPAPTEDSEDTVTDVTPLSTPDVSPLRALDLTGVVEAERVQLKEQRPDRGPFGVPNDTPQEDTDFGSTLDDCSLGAESWTAGEPLRPSGRSRKNYSFSNDEVRRIDRENQRLLRELSRPSPRSRSSSTVVGGAETAAASHCPPARLYHSTLNRQRELQRIERENMAFLKRLESVKATPGMRRSEQLAAHQRQAAYLGASSSTPTCRPLGASSASICRPLSQRERPSSGTSSGRGLRVASAGRNSTRTPSGSGRSSPSTTTTTTTTPVPRGKKASMARPDWC